MKTGINTHKNLVTQFRISFRLNIKILVFVNSKLKFLN